MKKITLRKTSLTLLSSDESRFRIRYRDELNEAQYEAVAHIEGPALVIAGAGTGKTRTLTYRVARLIESGVTPQALLLLTFTRKAAREMLRRAAMLLDERTERVSGGTFHGFANTVLRRHAATLGYTSDFTILDQGDSEDAVNLLRSRQGASSAQRRFPKKQTLFRMISASVNTVTPLDIVIARDYPQFEPLTDDILALARAYVAYKAKNNIMDYDDLLVNLLRLLEGGDEIRRTVAGAYRHVMVDEYQDTNALQARVVALLANEQRNVMVVGDDAQSIYSFRGANFRNIMDFPVLFPECRVITLEENYRSTQPILDFTNAVIEQAVEKHSKHLFTRASGGDPPSLVAVDTENTQSRFIVQNVLELREEGIPLSEMAVLFRAGYHSFDLEIELAKANIPYVKFGGLKLMDTAHVKDVIAHLRVLANPRDVISWMRILLLVDGIGPASAERVTDDIARGFNPLAPGGDARLRQLVRGAGALTLRDVLLEARGGGTVGAMVARLLEYYLPVLRERYDDHQKRVRDLEMFQTIAERYRELEQLLVDMALEPPTESVEDLLPGGSEDEFLTLSTIHSAKGLEWNTVHVLSLVDGRFPPSMASEGPESMEEERRLLYVACTRARRRLILTYPMNMYDRATGVILSKPSRFLDGLRDDLLDSYLVEE